MSETHCRRAEAAPGARRADVSDLVDLARPLTARSVLASALLGATEPSLPVAALVMTAGLFGISSGATRTCRWRMVANGELTAQETARTTSPARSSNGANVSTTPPAPAYVSAHPWDGTWGARRRRHRRRSTSTRPPRSAPGAAALHLAESAKARGPARRTSTLQRVPAARAVIAEQCVEFHSRRHRPHRSTTSSPCSISRPGRARAQPAGDRVSTTSDLTLGPPRAHDVTDVLTFRFLLSIAVIRHLQRDAHLPTRLLPPDWPAEQLRAGYRRHDIAFKHDLTNAGHAIRTPVRP